MELGMGSSSGRDAQRTREERVPFQFTCPCSACTGELKSEVDPACLPRAPVSNPLRHETIDALWDGLHMKEFFGLLTVLDSAYGGDSTIVKDPAVYSGTSIVEDTNGSSGSATYGEMLPVSLGEVLRKTHTAPGARFFDLGSGTGKLVNFAALLGLSATGIELETGRHEQACISRSLLFKDDVKEPPSFIHGNMLEVDFSEGDLILINSVAFSLDMIDVLAFTAQMMRPGSKIVSFRSLPGPRFVDVCEVMVQVSWNKPGEYSVCYVQEVVKRPGLLDVV